MYLEAPVSLSCGMKNMTFSVDTTYVHITNNITLVGCNGSEYSIQKTNASVNVIANYEDCIYNITQTPDQVTRVRTLS